MTKAPLNMEAALAKARHDFANADPAALAANAQVEDEVEDDRHRLSFPYFGEWYDVSWPSAEVSSRDSGDIPAITQVILLHYLLNAKGELLSGRWVSYRELPQGETYERAFHQRAIAPLEAAFGYDLNAFLKAGQAAGGEQARLGDASLYFRVLPRVSLLVVLWRGDDEVPPGGNILYDAAAGSYLPGEDLAYVGIALTARLLGARRGGLLT